jgi:uncharacterized protein YndB with AHSA1/START domain
VQQAADSGVLRREVRIAARPETVFEFFADPDKLVRWMGDAIELDPRPGGIWRVDLGGRGAAAVGEVVEVERPRRIVFTWGWTVAEIPLEPGESTVEVTLTPEGDGTLLELVHHGLARELHEFHRTGWDHYLERLATVAAGGDPGPDTLPDRIYSGEVPVPRSTS